MHFRAAGSILLLLFVVSAAAAFDLEDVYIRVNEYGDAVVTAQFQESPPEFPLVRLAGAAGTALSNEKIIPGSSGNIRILCSDFGVAVLVVPQFASVDGTRYETPFIDLSWIQPDATPSQATPLLRPRVTIVFPDGYTVHQQGDGTIHPVIHILGPEQALSEPSPACECCDEKDLPFSPIIPDEIAPAASVAAGIALTAIGLSAAGALFSQWFGHGIAFLENAAGGMISNRLAAKGRANRTLDYFTERRAFLGFSGRELIVLISGAFLIGVLFFFAARDPFDPVIIGIYVVMGGIALIIHEIGHWYLTRRYECYTEVRFWGFGALIMAITSWSFGNVFAQPTLTMVRHRLPLDNRRNGIIMLAGPLMSILIAILCLCIVPLGGIFRIAGMIGFSINLTTGVFELVPIPPCDGSDVRSWSTAMWAVIFLPALVLYLVSTI